MTLHLSMSAPRTCLSQTGAAGQGQGFFSCREARQKTWRVSTAASALRDKDTNHESYAEILVPNIAGDQANADGRRSLPRLQTDCCGSFCLHRRGAVERDWQGAKSGEPRQRSDFAVTFFTGNVRSRRRRHRGDRTRNSGCGRREDRAAGDGTDAKQLSGEVAAGQRRHEVSAGCFNHAII